MVDNTTVSKEVPLVSCMENMDHTEEHMEVSVVECLEVSIATHHISVTMVACFMDLIMECTVITMDTVTMVYIMDMIWVLVIHLLAVCIVVTGVLVILVVLYSVEETSATRNHLNVLFIIFLNKYDCYKTKIDQSNIERSVKIIYKF